MAIKIIVVTFDFGTEDLIDELSKINPLEVQILRRNTDNVFEKVKEKKPEKVFLDGTFSNSKDSKLEEFIDEFFSISQNMHFPLEVYSFGGRIPFPKVTPIYDKEEFKKMLQKQKLEPDRY
jgi:hypothetical protein